MPFWKQKEEERYLRNSLCYVVMKRYCWKRHLIKISWSCLNSQQTWSEPLNFMLPPQCWTTSFLCPLLLCNTQRFSWRFFLLKKSQQEKKQKYYHKRCQQSTLTTLYPWHWSTSNTYTGYQIRLSFPSTIHCFLKMPAWNRSTSSPTLQVCLPSAQPTPLSERQVSSSQSQAVNWTRELRQL